MVEGQLPVPSLNELIAILLPCRYLLPQKQRGAFDLLAGFLEGFGGISRGI